MAAIEQPEPELPAIAIVGDARFRALLDAVVVAGQATRVVAEIDPEEGVLDLVHVPAVDVLVVRAGVNCPSRAVEIARVIQRRRPGASVLLVIENLTAAHFAQYWWELSSWSLITPATCNRPIKVGRVLESVLDGIRWVDREISSVLWEYEMAGGPHAFAERGLSRLPDFQMPHGEWRGRIKGTRATTGHDGRWLEHIPDFHE